jgi:hypothetical protein
VQLDGSIGVDNTITFGFPADRRDGHPVGQYRNHHRFSAQAVLTGFGRFVFTDGTVDNNDGSPLVDDLFYLREVPRRWNAHVDADAHYNTFGWQEGRDPNALFSHGHLSFGQSDVRGVNPLRISTRSAWQEGRLLSLDFSPSQYLAANPDVAAGACRSAACIICCSATRRDGCRSRRPSSSAPAASTTSITWSHNPDVAAAGVDALQHFRPSAGTKGAIRTRCSTSTAIWQTTRRRGRERQPARSLQPVRPARGARSVGQLRTPRPYLAAYPDVAAAQVNPLAHYLSNGIHEWPFGLCRPASGDEVCQWQGGKQRIAAATDHLERVRRARRLLWIEMTFTFFESSSRFYSWRSMIFSENRVHFSGSFSNRVAPLLWRRRLRLSIPRRLPRREHSIVRGRTA